MENDSMRLIITVLGAYLVLCADKSGKIVSKNKKRDKYSRN